MGWILEFILVSLYNGDKKPKLSIPYGFLTFGILTYWIFGKASSFSAFK